MTNYERKKNMTIEEMAEDGVRVEYGTDNESRHFETSDGSYIYNYKKAIAHEIDWLKQEAEENE